MPLQLYFTDRDEWRAWLEANHATTKEAWLVIYKKHMGKPGISYEEAVEEALCFGWIDSTAKKVDEDRYAQRFSPRRPGSSYSPSNVARLRSMAAKGKIVPEVLAKVKPLLVENPPVIPPDILAALKADPVIWNNFRAFSDSYKRIRIGYIEGARTRPDEFAKRLRNFLAKTKQNRVIGFGGIQKHY